MAIELLINGSVDMEIFNMDGTPVTDLKEEEIYEKLQYGEYTIGLHSKHIVSYDDLFTPLYKFDFSVNCDMEYEFDLL